MDGVTTYRACLNPIELRCSRCFDCCAQMEGAHPSAKECASLRFLVLWSFPQVSLSLKPKQNFGPSNYDPLPKL